MKKVFLLLTSALMGVATYAGNTWELTDDNEIVIDYNGSGSNWQAGSTDVVAEAVQDAGLTFDGWMPEVGQSITFTLKATSPEAGKIQFALIDERQEADWYTEVSHTYVSTEVAAGEPFELSGKLSIENVDKSREGHDVALTAPGIVLSFVPAAGSELAEGDPLVLTNASYEIVFTDKVQVEEGTEVFDPAATAEDGQGHFQYEKKVSLDNINAADVKVGNYVNVEISGKPAVDIENMQFVFADNGEVKEELVPSKYDMKWWHTLTPYTAFAQKKAKDAAFDIKFSIPLASAVGDDELAEEQSHDFRYVLLFLTNEKCSEDETQNVLKIADYKVKVTVGEKLYAEPELAVEEVSNVAFENGVIYSSSIVVYNQAGQVVATASDEFAINTLKAGIYFAKTAEGAISFVVK